MRILVLSLLLAQCPPGGCATGPVATSAPTPATIRLVIEPPNADVWLGPYKLASSGRERIVTVPLTASTSYRIQAAWGTTVKHWDVTIDPGQSYSWKLVPDEFVGQKEQDGVTNFGVNREELQDAREVITANRREITKDEAKKLLEAGSLVDDSGKLRLTIIGSESDRKRVLDDLKGPLADLTSSCLVQAYGPTDWAVARYGFQTGGKPSVYVQDPGGKVLHRQDDYDGPEGLRKALEAVRKPNPNYDASRDPDRRKSIDRSALVFFGLAGLLLLFGLRKDPT